MKDNPRIFDHPQHILKFDETSIDGSSGEKERVFGSSARKRGGIIAESASGSNKNLTACVITKAFVECCCAMLCCVGR